MDFEEFFRKKKIDLSALMQAEPGLYEELKKHYEQMGEKSFDHTKKFGFNKWRRLFPLHEAPAEVQDTNPNPEKVYQPLFKKKPAS